MANTDGQAILSGIHPLDPEEPTPLYRQLMASLRPLILEVPDGSLIPSESELMAAAQVSRATVRRATNELVHEGLLRSRRGVRTYVSRQGLFGPVLKVDGFSEIAESSGRKPSSKSIAFALEPAVDFVSEQLQLAKGAPVYRNERIRYLDDRPVMVELQFLPSHLVPGLTAEDCKGSTYALMANRFGIRAIDGIETVQSVRAPEDIAKHLELPRGAPVVLGARIIWTESGERVEHVTRWVRTEVMLLTFRLGGTPAGPSQMIGSPVEPYLGSRRRTKPDAD
ncbi:MAG: GntR family transcriptional regulator [Acidimicrobiia bacterium]|nr:GntR family transcriptional regulator [Acidimicrobiia bacterium]